MRKTFSDLIFLFLVVFVVSFIFLMIGFPKAILLDRFLMQRGIFILAGDVKEGITSIKMSDVRILSSGKEIANLEGLRAGLTFWGLSLEGWCKKGKLRAEIGWGKDVVFRAKDFECASSVGKIESDLKISEDIKGKVSLWEIDTGIVTIDKVDLNFKGKDFEGRVLYGKFEFRGKGKVNLNRKDPLSSTLRAEFTGSIGRVIISGTLRNPSVKMPSTNLY